MYDKRISYALKLKVIVDENHDKNSSEHPSTTHDHRELKAASWKPFSMLPDSWLWKEITKPLTWEFSTLIRD